MSKDIQIQIDERPIILQYTKQGIQGATGATGPEGKKGDSWELRLTMTGAPDGKLVMELYENGEICKNQHYAFVQYMQNEGVNFAFSSQWTKNFTGSYSFNYTGMRAFFVTVYDDAFMEQVLCANSVNAGKAGTIRVGSVTSNQPASVTNRGTIYDAIFDFVLPKGDKGEVAVDSTVTLPAGSNATVEDLLPNDPTKALLKFGIPAGANAGARVEGTGMPTNYGPSDYGVILEAGWYFTPSVSSEGILSWTNDFDLDNPTPVQIAIRPVGTWSQSSAYTRLDLVYYQGNGYLAKKNVPANTAITNTNYWLRIVDKGDKGDAATITAGTAQTLPAGSTPTVTNRGDSHDAIFDFGIPKGDKGDAATVRVGQTTTLAPGQNAQVTNSGSTSAAVLNFAIPQGPAGMGIYTEYNDSDNYVYFEQSSNIVASDFSTTKAYAVGDIVVNAGKLFRFTTAHPAGEWNPSQVTEITVGSEIQKKANTADLGALAYKSKADYNTDINNLPVLGTLAAKNTADYTTDVTNKPTLGTLAAKNTVDYETDVTNLPTLGELSEKDFDENIAAEYDDTKTYQVGEYCIYNNELYRFTGILTAGSTWDSTIVVKINVAGELQQKANTSDLGTMSSANDAPQDDYYYGRRNKQWVVIGDDEGMTSRVPWGGITGTLSSQTDLQAALDGKQDTLTFDSTPTANSSNPVESGGIKTALDGKQNTLPAYDTTPTAGSANIVTSGGVKTALDTKLSLSGGTLTGDLSIKSSIMDVTDDSISLNNSKNIYFKDKNDIIVGFICTAQKANGTVQFSFGGYRNINNVAISNQVMLSLSSTGEVSISVSAPSTWRTALGAAPLASPAFTGTPTAPHPAITSWNNQIATTMFVQNIVSNHSDFKITGTVSADHYTLTDSRINDTCWEVLKVVFATPYVVKSDLNWSINVTTFSVTLSATYTGSTNVIVYFHWVEPETSVPN